MDNCSNSRANTCVRTQLHGRVVFIRYKTNLGSPQSLLVVHNNQTDRRSRRQIIQVSDLSAIDGRVLAYRGYDG